MQDDRAEGPSDGAHCPCCGKWLGQRQIRRHIQEYRRSGASGQHMLPSATLLHHNTDERPAVHDDPVVIVLSDQEMNEPPEALDGQDEEGDNQDMLDSAFSSHLTDATTADSEWQQAVVIEDWVQGSEEGDDNNNSSNDSQNEDANEEAGESESDRGTFDDDGGIEDRARA